MMKEGQVRIPSGCAIAAVISRDGKRMTGEKITDAMRPMHERSNGLGGGFAGYGIYPEYRDFYALHLFFDTRDTRKSCEAFLREYFEIVHSERIPTRKIPSITDEPIIWRFFVAPLKSMLAELQLDEKEFVARTVMRINTELNGAYVFSSGKNMGTFKAVGFPEDVGVFYKLDEYEGYSWTAHGRYPTNTPGWWGGAHPFTLLDYSVVHNGEISSYDANRRFIEMFGYKCTLQTDTEVITYILDYLVRVQGLSLQEAATVIAAPFWSTIEREQDQEKSKRYAYLRTVFPSLLVTGPFSIVLGYNGGLMALNDRLKLRSMVLCRTCQTGKCNWGIATQRPDLVKRLNPDIGSERLVNLMTAWRHEIMELMGGMGINSIEALRGNRLMLRGVGLNETELRILGIAHAGE